MSALLSGEQALILSTWSLTLVSLVGLIVQSHHTSTLLAQIARLLIRRPAPVRSGKHVAPVPQPQPHGPQPETPAQSEAFRSRLARLDREAGFANVSLFWPVVYFGPMLAAAAPLVPWAAVASVLFGVVAVAVVIGAMVAMVLFAFSNEG